jgi:hypothetical protein
VSQPELPEGTVTVLFTDLVESTRLNQTVGDDAAREISRQIEDLARRQVDAHRGVLIKEMGDGLMAAFASARRAVAAGQEIQADMRRLHREGLDDGVQMRIGLHTGEVLAEDGDIHGETVIIAKRIEGLAPAGGILASDTVHGVLGTARDEGIEAEWNLYLVPQLEEEPGDGLADSDPTPYIGRAAEREQLRTMVEAAAEGRGSMLLIGGGAGLGKSRLTREAAAIADRQGMTVRTGNCLDMASPPPYQPTIDQLEQTARRLSPDEFRAVLGENAPEIAKLMPSLRQRYDDIPPPPDLTPEQERRYLLHGMGEFLERAAVAQPLLLVFEDLHWADESTLLFLRHMGPLVAELPIMIIGTYRDDELVAERPLTTAIGPLVRDVGAVDMHIGLLTEDQVAAMLAARAGQDPPGELVELVFTETQGNPFFAEEVFRHLRDDGRLFDDDGAWRAGFEIGATEVPQGVRLVLGRRLDQLDTDHRKVMATAAVIGRTFSFAHLAASSGSDEDGLFDALEAAERLHLVEEAPADHDARYVFVHEQIRQTLLGELSLARRQRLHLRVADSLESSTGDAAAVELAHHLQQAGPAATPERAVTALLAAADANLDALAFEDALRHLENAEPLVDDEHRFDLRSMQARALRGAGRVDDALEVLDAELEIAIGTDRETTVRLQRVQLLNDQYRASEGLDDVAALVAAAGASDDPDLVIDVHLARGRAHYILSLDEPENAHESRDAYEAAYAAARERGDKRKMVLALLPTTWFTDYWADYSETASANIGEALELAEAIGDEDLVLDALAAMMHRGGVWSDTTDSEDLLARLEERRDPVKLNAHCFWMMWQYLARGRFNDAIAMCDRGIELAELIGTEPVQYGGIKAIALSEMGRFDEVAGAIDQEVTDDDHPFGQAMASLARSVYLTRISAWRPAADSLTDTLERATDLSRVWMQFWAANLMVVVAAHVDVELGEDVDAMAQVSTILGPSARGMAGAEVALVEGRPAEAVELAAPLVRDDDADPGRDAVSALDVLARAHLASGDHDEALAAAGRGLGPAEEMEFGAVAWRFRQVRSAALAALGDDEEAEAERSGAAREFRVLADRIVEPELRGWFEQQALAPA